MFNYNHLYYFYVTAKIGGITLAARDLKVSQPSLSSQLKTLEQTLDRQLFQKSGRRSVLTPDGEEVYGYCRKIFEAADELSDFLKLSSRVTGVRVSIGVTDQIERPFVTEIVGRLIRRMTNPKPWIKMHSGTHEVLSEALRGRQIDFLLSNRPVLGDEYRVLSSVEFPVGLVASTKLVEKKRGKAPSLTETFAADGIGLVIPSPRLNLRYEIDKFLQKSGITPPIFFESDILATVVRAICDGVGIGFVPLPYVAEELRQGRLRLVGPKPSYWKHGVVLVGRKGSEGHPAAVEICSALSRYAAVVESVLDE